MKNVDVKKLEYYDSFMSEINCHILQYEQQKIDCFMFSRLAESSLERYRGKLDVLFDLGYINYDEWKKCWDQTTDYVYEWQRKTRKADLNPSDPKEV